MIFVALDVSHRVAIWRVLSLQAMARKAGWNGTVRGLLYHGTCIRHFTKSRRVSKVGNDIRLTPTAARVGCYSKYGECPIHSKAREGKSRRRDTLGCDESQKRSSREIDRRYGYTGAQEESIVICLCCMRSNIASVWLGYDRIPPVEGRSKKVRVTEKCHPMPPILSTD